MSNVLGENCTEVGTIDTTLLLKTMGKLKIQINKKILVLNLEDLELLETIQEQLNNLQEQIDKLK